MTNITLTFDNFDFLSAVEGFALGSHLRQNVWENIVFANMKQMDDDFMDFLWFYLRRDVWPHYEPESYTYQGKVNTINPCGREDFIHCMAALHRGNRYKVTFRNPEVRKDLTIECYRFNGNYHHIKPFVFKGITQFPRFSSYIPEEWVKKAEYLGLPENLFVERGREEWWENIKIYDDYDLHQ